MGALIIHFDFWAPVGLHLDFKVNLQMVQTRQINILHLTFVNNVDVRVIEKMDPEGYSRF